MTSIRTVPVMAAAVIVATAAGTPGVGLMQAVSSWCPGNEVPDSPGEGGLMSFALENGKTVTICRNPESSELTYYYGAVGDPPELEYRGPLLGTIPDWSFSADLPELVEYGAAESGDLSQQTLAEIAAGSDSGGFVRVFGTGVSGGEETSYLFRTGGWQYAVRIGYSRNRNPEIVAELGNTNYWEIITLISPDGQDYTIR